MELHVVVIFGLDRNVHICNIERIAVKEIHLHGNKQTHITSWFLKFLSQISCLVMVFLTGFAESNLANLQRETDRLSVILSTGLK